MGPIPWLGWSANARRLRRLTAATVVAAVSGGSGIASSDLASELTEQLKLPVATGQTAASEARQLRQRLEMATKLGKVQVAEQALMRLVELDRSPRNLNDLGLFRSDQGDFLAAQALLEAAVAAAPPELRGFYRANLALNLRRQFMDQAAQAEVEGALRDVADYKDTLAGWRPNNLARSRTVALIQLSRIQERQGRFEEALKSAHAAEVSARKAIETVPARATDLERQQVVNDLGNSVRRQVYARLAMQDAVGAQFALRHWLQLARDNQLSPEIQAQTHQAAAAVALSVQAFSLAERQAREAEQVYARLGYAPVHLARVTGVESLLGALWAQGKFRDALGVLDQLDVEARGQEAVVERVRLPLVRGLIYLDARRFVEASSLFEARAAQMGSTAGPGSVQFAEAIGLQGVAQWRSGREELQESALYLLAQALAILSAPDNAGAPDGSGLRERIRRLIIDAHLDALAQKAPERLAEALGLIDWAGGSVVQKAVAEAAVRMGTRSPLMRDLIRAEQDARREIDALRRSAAGEDELALKVSADIAPRIGRRISELDGFARDARQRIRQSFPDYARLTQPRVIRPQEVAAVLQADEAMLAVWTRERDTLVWLLRRSGPAKVIKVDLPADESSSLVKRLRQGIEFRPDGSVPPFDTEASRTLHQKLLAPLAPDLQGVLQLVVVANGALSTLPLAVLQEGAGSPTVAGQQSWLIRRYALSQAPSVSSWLNIRSAPPQGGEALPLMGWADPLFSRKAAPAASGVVRNALAFQPHTEGGQAVSTQVLIPAEFSPLPETRDELMAIAASLNADPARDVYVGARATRESVLAASASGELGRRRVVVFATHGLMAGEVAGLDQPALAMAATPFDRTDALAPFLKLDDVLGLKMNADWVVMSACNTAAADGQLGEALSGLARGMFYAGARSLLVTHWAVESRSAMLLTIATFKAYMGSNDLSKSQSLREAMLTVSQTPGYQHPAFWAPFAIVGDGGR